MRGKNALWLNFRSVLRFVLNATINKAISFVLHHVCSTLTDLPGDWQVGALANKDQCYSGQYTTSGECCRRCMPGEGVVKPCGATQTECAPCVDSE